MDTWKDFGEGERNWMMLTRQSLYSCALHSQLILGRVRRKFQRQKQNSLRPSRPYDGQKIESLWSEERLKAGLDGVAAVNGRVERVEWRREWRLEWREWCERLERWEG